MLQAFIQLQVINIRLLLGALFCQRLFQGMLTANTGFFKELCLEFSVGIFDGFIGLELGLFIFRQPVF